MDIRAHLTVLGLAMGVIAAFVNFTLSGLSQILINCICATLSACWLASILALESPKYQLWMIDHLCQDNYRPLYMKVTTAVLARTPRGAKLYDWSLILAFMYPILLLWGEWLVTGDPGRLGDWVVIAPEPNGWLRALSSLALLPAVPWLLRGRFRVWAQRQGSPAVWRFCASDAGSLLLAVALALAVVGAEAVARALAGALAGVLAGVLALAGAVAGALALAVVGAGALALAGAGAGAGAVAGLVAVAGAVAGAGALALAVAVAGAVAGAVAVAVAGAMAGAGAVAGAVVLIKIRPPWARNITIDLYATLIILASAHYANLNDSKEILIYIVFFSFFPLINAAYDFFSYAATLKLIELGNRRLGWTAVGLGLVDFALACVLYLCLGGTILAALITLNHVAPAPILPLAPVFSGLRQDPMGHLWAPLMLFSTILPTLAHFAVATLALSAFAPKSWRNKLVGWVGSEDPVEKPLLSLSIALIWFCSGAIPCALLYGLYWALTHWVGWEPLLWYLDLMERFARALGGL